MAQEQRSFARVATRISALARRCDSLEDPLKYKSGPSLSRDHLDEESVAGLPKALVEFLLAMDQKLDLLLSHLGRESLERDFPLVLDVRDISGAGLRFKPGPGTESPVPGQVLEVVLLLGQHPPIMAGAKGVVLDDRNGDGTLGFEFHKIRRSDQENIVRFVFQEEREQIRDSKA